jgi:hypothetical protein
VEIFRFVNNGSIMVTSANITCCMQIDNRLMPFAEILSATPWDPFCLAYAVVVAESRCTRKPGIALITVLGSPMVSFRSNLVPEQYRPSEEPMSYVIGTGS